MKLTKIDIDSELNKFSSQLLARQTLQFPIRVRMMTIQECKEYHLKKLYELSLKWREKNAPEKPNKKRDRLMMEIAWHGYGWRYSK